MNLRPSLARHAPCYVPGSLAEGDALMPLTDNQTRFTVLLADAQDPWHATVSQLLAPQGVRTVSAHTGREALSVIEQQMCHVAVLDVEMPHLGGLQVIRRIKALRQPPPAILLARQLSSQLLQEALGLEVFTVLAKPVDFNILLDALARVLSRHYKGRWPA